MYQGKENVSSLNLNVCVKDSICVLYKPMFHSIVFEFEDVFFRKLRKKKKDDYSSFNCTWNL